MLDVDLLLRVIESAIGCLKRTMSASFSHGGTPSTFHSPFILIWFLTVDWGLFRWWLRRSDFRLRKSKRVYSVGMSKVFGLTGLILDIFPASIGPSTRNNPQIFFWETFFSRSHFRGSSDFIYVFTSAFNV